MFSGTSSFPAPSSNPTLTNVLFSHNVGSHFGGGMCEESGASVMTNVIFDHDSGGTGGGLYHFSGNTSLTNVTFSRNVAYSGGESDGGGMYNDLTDALTMRNVIFWGNTSNQFYSYRSNDFFYHCIVDGGLDGPGAIHPSSTVVDSGGNISSDPLFLNAGSGDVRLSAGSPAIDAGTNAAVSMLTDFGGNPRIVGPTVDIGAYEFLAAFSSYSQSISSNDSLVTLGSTKAGLLFSGIAPGKSVLVFSNQYQTAPDSVTFSGPPPSHYSPFRWVIAKSGDIFSNAVLTLDNVSSFPGVSDPSSLVIYKRGTPGSGSFSPLVTTYDAGSDKLSATISSFSEFIVGSDNNPLAVQLVGFNGTSDRLNATLTWKTSTEVNNLGFTVERRLLAAADSSQPGQSAWTMDGFVHGAGTSTSPKSYSFVERNLVPGRYSFRLAQIAGDSSLAYSQAITLDVGLAPRKLELAQNYPNPFNPSTTIEFTLPEDGRVKVRVFDILGREVAILVDDERKAGVYQQIQFNASRISSGVYFSTLEFKDKRMVKKMILIK